MPELDERSKKKLETLHPYLRRVLGEAIKVYPFLIVGGWRSEEDQEEAYRTGASTKRWPDSTHNNVASQEDVDAGFAPNVGAPLSLGADLAPVRYDPMRIEWERMDEFYMLAGLCRGIGEMILPEGWAIRLGGDWDSDGYTDDQRFIDAGHIELRRVG